MTATRSPQPFLTLARGRGPYMTEDASMINLPAPSNYIHNSQDD
jgi:hypothetical protein